ncbi:amylo-alpha-1,6-glucosidase [Paenibacillus thermotolerans]|uniref:amylo-alpha-1,6-glucosidase n=1 Tax=Paenibacillus thermotolerans TaxID=3027807 RepID=UPI002367DC85|nr:MULTISPECIES: amylo-alpha-1,6-glucosidase [unclassified Paenibacillus]
MDYLVIKEGNLFLLTDPDGDIRPDSDEGHGLYMEDTRFLSKMELRVDGEKPSMLASEADKGYFAAIRMMRERKDEGAIEVLRERFIHAGVLYERVSLTNYFPAEAALECTARFDADFQDMFLVRKYRTGEVGAISGRESGAQRLSVRYEGKDGIERRIDIGWDRQGAETDDDAGLIRFRLTLAPKETTRIVFTIAPSGSGTAAPSVLPYEEALRSASASFEDWLANTTQAASDSERFNVLFRRGARDLRMLLADIGHGPTTVAGLPWFAVPFGRDSLITALFMLPFRPDNAGGTLRTLAAYQGKKDDPWRDEQPGKIMHEIRFGELVTTGQSPFGPYYGSADSTPLFLLLIVEYVRWTGDSELVTELRPNIERALGWIDRNMHRFGFVAYHQEAEKGFPNQGWKDSANSIVHESGEYARSPIALSEVQGYVYQAKKGLASLFAMLGDQSFAEKLEWEAEALKSAFEKAFWMEEERFYAIALDKDGRQVRSVTSNPGHLLMSGLPAEERAAAVAERLLSEDMFSGFGIRTMSTEAAGYYPMSYHNGSVWPHDNGMILLGLVRLGRKREISRLIQGLLDASGAFEYRRLPELFCGYGSKTGEPVPYPTTCSPQAWAAATAIVMLQAMLGLKPDVPARKVALDPVLPEGLNRLTATNIRIGQGVLSVELARDAALPGNEVKVTVLGNTTGCELITAQGERQQ